MGWTYRPSSASPPPLLLCTHVSCCSAREASSPVFQREPSFACSELWVPMDFPFRVIASGSDHQKFLTSSAVLTTPVLSSDAAIECLLILIALWSFGGLLETRWGTKAKSINFSHFFHCAYHCTWVWVSVYLFQIFSPCSDIYQQPQKRTCLVNFRTLPSLWVAQELLLLIQNFSPGNNRNSYLLILHGYTPEREPKKYFLHVIMVNSHNQLPPRSPVLHRRTHTLVKKTEFLQLTGVAIHFQWRRCCHSRGQPLLSAAGHKGTTSSSPQPGVGGISHVSIKQKSVVHFLGTECFIRHFGATCKQMESAAFSGLNHKC